MFLNIIVNKGRSQLELFVSFLCLSFELTLPQLHSKIQNAAIKIKTVGPYNHKSLQAEHGIKSLSNIWPKH